MVFTGLTSASHMSLPEAGYGSEEGYVGSGAVSGVTTPGASRLQASQSQQRSTTMQRLHDSRGNHDSASGISTDTLRSSDFSGAITRSGSLRVPSEVTFVASPQRTEDQPSECPHCRHRHWPGVHTCADCCMNAPPNLKPGRESPSSSESGSSSQALPDLEDSSSEGETSNTGMDDISGDYWEHQFQDIWNQEFLQRQNWLLAEASYRGRLRDWFRASCQFIRDSGRLRFDAQLQEQEDWEELLDQFDHQAAVMVQMAIIAEERRQNVRQHAGPSGAWGRHDEEVDEMRCDSTHSHLSREQLSKLPDSNSSVDSWVDEVRSKGKGTRCPSCGKCAKDCSCRRQISSLENRVKELKKAAKEKKRDDDSKWKEMEQKLEKLTDLVQNLSTTGLTGPAPTMASHPAPTSSAAPTSTPYGAPHSPAPPAFAGHH